jgi:hypothetical protein
MADREVLIAKAQRNPQSSRRDALPNFDPAGNKPAQKKDISDYWIIIILI